MKKTVIYIGCALFLGLLLLSDQRCQAATQKERDQLTRDIKNATKDVAKNKDILLSLYENIYIYPNGIDDWRRLVADKIPNQPKAVIAMMAQFDGYNMVHYMCPKEWVRSELSIKGYILWLEKSVAALEALSLKEPRQERIRKRCLMYIEERLDDKESLKSYREKRPEGTPLDPTFLAIDKAVKDVSKNFDLLLSLRKKVSSHDIAYWNKAISDKLPEKAEAVILLMERTNAPVKEMCPRGVWEGELDFDEYVLWLEKSVTALKTLSFKNSKQENIRKKCLKEIEKSLATKEEWKY